MSNDFNLLLKMFYKEVKENLSDYSKVVFVQI